MEIGKQLVGATFAPFEAAVGPRATTNYAAAIGDTNPIYFDDTGDGQVAPLLFPVALSWPLLSDLPGHADFELSPIIGLSVVHYAEQLKIARLLRPGDRVRVSTRVAAVTPHKSSTVLTLVLEAKDTEGRLFYTEYIEAMLRAVPCVDEGGAEPGLPVLSKVEVSEPEWSRPLSIDPLLSYIYDGCTDIVFGIHTSPRMATALGFPGIILQGTATLALAVRILLEQEGVWDPSRVRAIGGQFRGMVVPGQMVELRLLRRDSADGRTVLHFDLLNPEGRRAIQAGRIEIC